MEEEEYLQQMSHKNKPRKRYTVAEKLAIIKRAKETSNRSAALHFKVDEKQVREWRKQVRSD